MGLGSKSPFCYTDSFSVTVFFNKKKRIYNSFLNEHGIPSIALLQQIDTEEDNGVEVKLSVKEADFSIFLDNTITALKYFRVKPVVLGTATQFASSIKVPEYIISNARFGIRQAYSYSENNIRAIQGQVAYPISPYDLPNLSNKHKGLFNLHLDLYFDIGRLDVAASREQLSFNEYTRKNIEELLDLVNDDLSQLVYEKIVSSESLWQACIFYSGLPYHIRNCIDLTGNHPYINYINTNSGKINFKTSDLGNEPFVIRDYYNKLKPVIYSNDQEKTIHIDVTREVKIIIDDLKRGVVSRIKQNNYKNCRYIVIQGNSAVVKKILKRLGNPPVILASTIPYQSSAKKVAKAKVYTIDGSSKYWCYKSENDFDPSKGGFYLPYYEKSFFKSFTLAQRLVDIDQIVYNAIRLKLINPDDVKSIKKFNLRQYTRFSKQGNWINLYDYIVAEYNKIVLSKYANAIQGSLKWKSFDTSSTYVVRSLINDLIVNIPNNPSIREFANLRDALNGLDIIEKESALKMYSMLLIDIDGEKKAKEEMKGLIDRFLIMYPMIKYCSTLGATKDVIDYIKLIDLSKK